jgi:hypothetical protein
MGGKELESWEIWARQVADTLGVPESDFVPEKLLDMTGVVAHNQARPAAPLSSFLAGYVLAKGGYGNLDQVIAEIEKQAVKGKE